ncbi:transposase [Micromonospora sonchi]|uniref:transposase n=1 Tax=Micromonospora sonchi TaxID=1763543 RepID=UPI0027E4C096|nr:transposase [Micromonospora sonchi]
MLRSSSGKSLLRSGNVGIGVLGHETLARSVVDRPRPPLGRSRLWRRWVRSRMSWSDAWAEFVPFLAFDVEIRKVICSTNAIESVNARIRKAVRARGHFPNEQAALKCVYMALMSLDPTGAGRRRWTMRWKAPLNAFQIAFDGRLTPANH